MISNETCINYITKELTSAKYNLKQAHLRKDISAVERLRNKIDVLTEIDRRLGVAVE